MLMLVRRILESPPETSNSGNAKPSNLGAEALLLTIDESSAAGITRVQEHQWRSTKPGTLGESGTAVLVSMGPRGQEADRHASREPNRAKVETTTSDCDSPEAQDIIPTRFAINSQRLMTLLAKSTKQNISSTHNTWVRPFKYLVYFEKEIRAGYQEICGRRKSILSSMPGSKRVAASDEATTPTNCLSNDIHSQPESSLEKDVSARDMALWSCVIDFMDNDMRDIFDMRAKAAENALSEIEFGDLWCLYRPGDLVYHRFTVGGKSRDRAYRILFVTGGRSILDTTNRSGENLRDYGDKFKDSFEDLDDRLNVHRNMRGRASGKTPLVIDCFFLDFDGDRWGPRPRRFVIPEFTGLRSIKQLEAVPVRFMPHWADIETDLVNRGRQFVDTAIGTHRLCTGRGYPDKWLKTSQYEVR